jgi:two-component system copper resistance phosphate regulon response regulator CusR
MAHLLLVEDNQNNADYIIRIIEGMGHTVDHFLRGLDGARAARQDAYDMILMDFNLPDIDGKLLILTLKKQLGTGCPQIVAVTARTGSIDRQLAKRFGADAFVGKPFEPAELSSVIEALLAAKVNDPKGK